MGGVRPRSGSGKEIKTKGSGKGCWDPMKRDDQPGGIRWTSIALPYAGPRRAANARAPLG